MNSDKTHQDTFEEIEDVEFELFYMKDKLSAIDLGSGDVDDVKSGNRVRVGPGRSVYISVTTKHGNLTIWKVASSQFIFATEDDPPRYITARKSIQKWLPVWQRGSDPKNVDEKNMSSDKRVWEVFEKFGKYFLRLEMDKHLYLMPKDGKLSIYEVEQPNNTSNITSLRVVRSL